MLALFIIVGILGILTWVYWAMEIQFKSDYGTFTILRYKGARSWRVKVDIFPS